jgi:hypothetical protein
MGFKLEKPIRLFRYYDYNYEISKDGRNIHDALLIDSIR